MEKNSTFTESVVDINDDGYGVIKVNGEVVFVPYVLPGEQISGVVINAKSKFAIGKATTISCPNPARAIPACPYFGMCGGCDLQHMSSTCQAEFKQNKVTRLIKKIAGKEVSINKYTAKNALRYRNKIALPVSPTGEIGLYRKNTHTILPITDCLISKEWTKDLIICVQNYMKAAKLTGYNQLTKSGTIKHIVAREVNNSYLFTIVVTKNDLPNSQILINELKKHFDNFGLNININALNNNTILSNKWKHIYGQTDLSVCDNGINYTVNNASFLQVNTAVQDELYADIFAEINPNDVVINAYSGAGLLSAQICTKAKKCYGVEIVKQATESADKLKKENNITNLTNICADCAVAIPQIISENKSATVVLDPPRKGVEKSILDAIIQAGTKKIIYVSCDPSTLSRDIKILGEGGYQIKFVNAYDMFPQTSHVESLVCLVKND